MHKTSKQKEKKKLEKIVQDLINLNNEGDNWNKEGIMKILAQELAKAKVSSANYREGFQAGVRTQTNLDAEDVQRARKEVIEKLNEWKEKKKIKIPSDRWQEAPEYADGNNTILQDLQDYLERLEKEK